MKNVVITGADRNLGLEMTRQFLQRGWRVFAGRYLSQLTLLDELQKEYPDTLHILTIDASSEESVRESARQVAEVTDTVDIMLHNAAVFNGSGGVLRGDVDYEAFVSSYNINCLGAMRDGTGVSSADAKRDETALFCLLRGGGGRCGPPHRDIRVLHVKDSAEYGAPIDV